MSADSALESLARIRVVIEDLILTVERIRLVLVGIDEGDHAVSGTGSMDFGRGMAHAAELIREAIGRSDE